MNKVNIGVVGAGGRGLFLSRVVQRTEGAKLVAIADLKENKLKVAKEYLGSDLIFSHSHKELLTYDQIDAVIVATADWEHEIVAMDALKSNKHIICEKPLTTRLEGADNLIKLWETKKHLVFMVWLELRYNNFFINMKEIIDRGDIGDIKLAFVVDSCCLGNDFFFHHIPRIKSKIVSLINQKGCHSLDIINWIVKSTPDKVCALTGLDYFGGNEPNNKRCGTCDKQETCPDALRGGAIKLDYGDRRIIFPDKCVFAREVTTEDNHILLIQYKNGIRGTYISCYFTPDYVRQFTFIGTKGRLYGVYGDIPRKSEITVTYRADTKIDKYDVSIPDEGHGGGDFKIIKHFIDCIKDQKHPLTDIYAARESIAVGFAAVKSAEIGEMVSVKKGALAQTVSKK